MTTANLIYGKLIIHLSPRKRAKKDFALKKYEPLRKLHKHFKDKFQRKYYLEDVFWQLYHYKSIHLMDYTLEHLNHHCLSSDQVGS